ncbi:malic enzyme-like NAD(P)-binding protein [Candidatus Vidania fulgoroideorum]
MLKYLKIMKKEEKLKKKSLNYHKKPKPGKIEINCKKKIRNIKDLSYAYSPGVAYVCKEIHKNKKKSYDYTSKGNLVAVITNGTAVLGLGNIGAEASKPVMEGKSALFKKFAGIDSIDIEIKENNTKKIIDIIRSLEPSFGGINLEDIKSPECFIIEKKCKKKMSIPVFHDDQHGTAVVVLAALTNSLKIVKKKINKIKTIVMGAGAAALSCLKLLIKKGLNKKNIYVFDINGLIHKKRKDLNVYNKKYSRNNKKSLIKTFKNCDFFLGLSSGNIIKPEMIKKMNKKPIIFALANPNPEIMPEKIKKVRKDAIIATGRSDYKNQVNNLLCFPYIFRASLDLRMKISEKMKIIASKYISKLSRKDGLKKSRIIPNIFDKRLISYIPYKIVKYFNKKKSLKINMKKYKLFLKSVTDND